jgi:hypothetical protein
MADIYSFSIYDILNEADDDEGGGDNAATDTAGGDDNATADTGDDTGDTGAEEGQEEANDDDFDIDTNIDDPGEDSGGDDDGGDTDTGSDSGSSLGGGSDNEEADGNDEANKANTDIFDSLSAEEQVIKIMELKNQYRNLYKSIDDIVDKLQSIDIDEDELEAMSRTTKILNDLKSDISYYFAHIFSSKSYIENDIKYTEFLVIANSASKVIEEIAARKAKRIGVDIEETDKK